MFTRAGPNIPTRARRQACAHKVSRNFYKFGFGKFANRSENWPSGLFPACEMAISGRLCGQLEEFIYLPSSGSKSIVSAFEL